MSADPLPTVQIDGVIWTQIIIGNIVYAGGSFANARPAGYAPGVSTVARHNLLAYNIETGVLLPTFAPDLNGQVLALAASPDGTKLYIGGDFTQVDGLTRSRIAAYDLTSNSLISTFTPVAATTVRAIVASSSVVYFGGSFVKVGGVSRPYLAAVSTSGALLGWNPVADAPVTAMTMTTDNSKLVAGGRFQHIGGQPWFGMAALDPTTAAILPWAASASVRDAGTGSSITSLTAQPDGVYGTGYNYNGLGNLEGAFRADPATGTITWAEDCHGDTYSLYAGSPDVVYVASHEHYCGTVGGFQQTAQPWTTYRGTAFSKAATQTISTQPYAKYFNWGRTPAPTLLNWFPTFAIGSYTGQSQAGWSVTGNSQYVAYGGEFPTVNGTAQQGLVRFAVSSLAPNRIGPTSNDQLTPSVVSLRPGTVRVSWQETFDRDNALLTYKVYRNFKSLSDTPIYTTTADSRFWQRDRLGFVDSTVVPGQTYNYRVYAFDPFGNSVSRAATTITVPTGASTAETAYPAAVRADGPSLYWRLGENAGSPAFDSVAYDDGVRDVGVTKSTDSIVPYDSDQSATFDGMSDGTITSPVTEPAPTTFSVEAWIKTTSTSGGVIATYKIGSDSFSQPNDRLLYMDNSGHITFGMFPGSIQTVTTADSYNDGQWHQVVATLSSAGMQLYVDARPAGSLAGVTGGQTYIGFWRLGGETLGSWPNLPTSSFLAGTIDEFAVYPTALTVNQINNHWMASGRASAIPPPNQPPVAAFTSSTTNLTVAFNGTGSSDPDGTVTGYAWTFGDGTSGSGATVSHVYSIAGTYTATLTVTDNIGGTNTVSHPVTVTNPPPFAQDLFGRTVTAGLGSADLGGPWTMTGGTTGFAVSSGAAQFKMTAPGVARTAVLAGVASASSDVRVDVSVDKPITAGGVYLSVFGRWVNSTNSYRSQVKLTSDGQVALSIFRLVNNKESSLSSTVVAGLTYTPGTVLTIRTQVSGSSTAALAVKVWPAGTSEPATFQLTATDASPSLAAAGGVGLVAYLSSTANNAPVVASFDNLVAQPTG